jgi:acetate kinase
MNGADAIVFTGGIGEHALEIRARVCASLSFAGLILDKDANATNQQQISDANSSLHAFCIPTDEELLIARDTVRCIFRTTHPL